MFTITGQEAIKMDAWVQEHNKDCSLADPEKQGASGGRFTYSFTPTSLGTAIKIKCGCGKEKDVTEYDW